MVKLLLTGLKNTIATKIKKVSQQGRPTLWIKDEAEHAGTVKFSACPLLSNFGLKVAE